MCLGVFCKQQPSGFFPVQFDTGNDDHLPRWDDSGHFLYQEAAKGDADKNRSVVHDSLKHLFRIVPERHSLIRYKPFQANNFKAVPGQFDMLKNTRIRCHSWHEVNRRWRLIHRGLSVLKSRNLPFFYIPLYACCKEIRSPFQGSKWNAISKITMPNLS